MNCFKVIVEMKGENIEFPRMWGKTKVDVCMECLTAVKQFYKLDMNEFAKLTATAKIEGEVL